MSQIKIYGLREHLQSRRGELSDAIHQIVMEVLGLPEDKRAHRFFLLDAEDFFMPGGRSAAYTILEIYMIQGRTTETRKRLVRRLFEKLQQIGIQPVDLEICIIESPAENWGFRGFHGDEVKLNYKVEV